MTVPDGESYRALEQTLAARTAELEQARACQEALGDVLRVIGASGGELQAAFDAITERAVSLCGATFGALSRFDGSMLDAVAIHGASAEAAQAVRDHFPMPPGRGSIGARAVLERAPVQSADVFGEDGYAMKDAMRTVGARSALGVPLLRDDTCIGSLVVLREDERIFPEHEVQLLQTFADQAVVAMENARLFNKTADALERQTATADVLRVISASPTDLQPVFDVIARLAFRLCRADVAMVVRIADEQAHLETMQGGSHALVDAMRSAYPLPLGRGGIGSRVALEGKPVQIPDYLADPDVNGAVRDAVRRGGVRSGLGVPLRHKDGVFGVLGIGRLRPGGYDGEVVSLLETFADQAAIAIENVRLFNETREALDQQTAISEVLRVISASPGDVEPVFEAIAGRAMVLCDAEMGTVARLDGDMLDVDFVKGMSEAIFEKTSALFPMKVSRQTLTGRAILERAPVQIPDMLADPEYELRAAAQEWRSGLAVPLVREGQVTGALMVARRRPGAFSDAQVRLLQTFAGQAVIAVENARLFNETREALERQTATAEILRVISASPTDLQPVFDTIADRAMALCRAKVGVVARFDGKLAHLAAVKGMSEATVGAMHAIFPLSLEQTSLTTRAIRERGPVQTAHYARDPDIGEAIKVVVGDEAPRSALAVPMLREDEVIGTVFVGRDEPGAFADELVHLLETFAAQAVIAIENARLFRETRDGLEQQTAVSDILREITESPGDVEPVLGTLAGHAARLCDAASASIFLIEGDQLRHVASRGPEAAQATTAERFAIDRTSTSGRAVLERRTVHIDDMQDGALADEFPLGQALARRMGHHSIVVAPLLRAGQPFGTLLLRRMEVRPFGEREMKLLRTFGDQAAIALETARLFNETEEALEQQTATAEVLRVISSSVADTAPVFETIVERCAALFDTEQVAIFLVDADGRVNLRAALILNDETASLYPRPLAESVHGMAVEAGRALHFPRIGNDTERPWESDRAYELLGDHSLMIAPMIREGRPMGTILIGRIPARAFTEKELALLSTFADQAVIAIQNARLFNETQEALEQQTATAEVLRVIGTSVEDTAPVFEKIIESCRHLFATDQIAITQLEDDAQIALRAVSDLIREEAVALYPRSASDSVHGLAIEAGRTLHWPDVAGVDEMTGEMREVFEQVGNHSVIVAPMMWQGRGIGAVLVARIPQRPFSDKEIALLTTFANQAVVAIQNARLFRETNEALEQQTATAEVLRVISSSVADTAPVFEKILDSCERLFDSEEIGIFVVGDDDLLHLGAPFRGSAAKAVAQTHPRPLEKTATHLAIRERRALHYEHIAPGSDVPGSLAEIASLVGDFSIVLAPMLWEGRGVGAVVAVHVPPRPFTNKDIELLTTFADQAVIAIENARLFHEIEDKSRQLELANQHKSEFLANMSHELRTPLNAVIGFSEVLIEGMFGELNEKQADYLKDIHASGKHLLSLINDILDLSKIEAGRMELEVEEFDVAAALDNTLTLVRERAERHGIRLGLETGSGLGRIRADQRKFKQVMLNLLSNAVKFTPDGGKVDVRAAATNGSLEIAVADTGIGIAKADQGRIFEEFQQAGGTYANKQEGTGLGLSLTKRIVELHGGTLTVDSEAGRGATFRFTLPGQP